MKKTLCLTLSLLLLALAGCTGESGARAITVISREDGSGTRGAFIELFGIEQKDADGNKVDRTSDAAEITSSTAVMMTTVAGNPDAIGYLSLGSLNDTVKALAIDGAQASVDNIKSGAYAISRPFYLATGAQPGALAQDFIAYILSDDGQAIVESSGYLSAEGGTGAFASALPEGKLVIAGSSSVSPLMQKLIEGYQLLNPQAALELQQSDSTTGVTSVADGLSDIGMASRALKDSELALGLSPTVIALDGIAVIVSPDNPCDGLSSEQVRDIFTGALTSWSELD